jgi:hypothetical protein
MTKFKKNKNYLVLDTFIFYFIFLLKKTSVKLKEIFKTNIKEMEAR